MAGEQVSEAVLRELYQGDPAEFVACRDRWLKQARDAGDDRLAAEIKALRKPTTAAWLVNRVSAEQRDRVDELVEVGDGLRAAQRDLRGDEIRRLDRRRSDLIRDLTERAEDVASRAGKRLGEQARRQVESTFAAAVAEPESGRRVRSGVLSGALTYSGFGLDELSVAAMRSATSSRRAHDSGARTGARRRAHTRVGRSGADRPDADGEGSRSAARAHDTERAARGTSGKRRGGRRTAHTPASEPTGEASAARAQDRAAEPQPRRERTDRKTRRDRGVSERTTERPDTSESAGRTKRASRPSTGRDRTSDAGVDEASEELRQAEDELRAAEQERDDQERDRDELRARLDDLSVRLRETTRTVTRARRQRDTARRRYDSLRQRR